MVVMEMVLYLKKKEDKVMVERSRKGEKKKRKMMEMEKIKKIKVWSL